MGDFTAVVRRYMKARGMSMRATASAAGYSDHTLLSKVLNGHKPVTPYLAASLDGALGADGEIIAAAQSAQAVADAARLPLRELADHAAELGAWAETGTAGPGTIAALDEEIGRVSGAYGTSPAGPLIIRASDACRRASGLLRQHQRLRHARELYVIATRCCAFLAVALGDLGRQTEAGGYARTSLTLAEESADPGAVALALSALGKIAFWDGRRRQSADFAARGYATARTADPLRVLLACQQSDASPVPLARNVLELAVAAREESTPAGTGGGLFDCGGVRLAGYRATLGLREGSLSAVLAALAAAEQAAADGEEVPYASLVQVRLCAALALLASGDADQAAGQLAFVLSLPADMRLATFEGRLSQAGALASAAPYKGSPAARQITEDVAGYLGADPVAMPHPLAIEAGSVR
jgi:transcriptional regulator with XRE-family HTH domain